MKFLARLRQKFASPAGAPSPSQPSTEMREIAIYPSRLAA